MERRIDDAAQPFSAADARERAPLTDTFVQFAKLYGMRKMQLKYQRNEKFSP